MSEPRNQQSFQRRREILDAALACFLELGYEQTSIAELCKRSGASVGSVYHHFGNKQRIAGALYLEGIRQVHQATLEALLPCRSAEKGARALADSYLGWVEKHPHHARFLLNFRHADFMGDVEKELAESNRGFRTVIAEWAKPFVEAGELPRIDPELYNAILIAPSERFARNWLDKRARTDIASARKLLSTAAWHGLSALR